MRYALVLLLLLSACAPLVCPEGEELKKLYSERDVPSSYSASLSVRYGLLRIPVSVSKSDGRFVIRGEGRTAEVFLGNLCVAGACIDLPVSPDGLIFGKVLRGDEKMGCSPSGVYFEREEGPYRSKFVFRDKRLSLVELYDKRGEKKLTLNYLEWSKDGYARAIKVRADGLDLLLTVDNVKF